MMVVMKRRLTHNELLQLDSNKIKGTKEYIRYVNVYEEKDGTMSICHNLFVLKNDAIMAGMGSPNYRYSKEVSIVV